MELYECHVDEIWKANKIKGVIQVGMGFEHAEIKKWDEFGIKHRIYFEPHPFGFGNLFNYYNSVHPPHTKIFNLALADFRGTADFYTTANHDSSSLLPLKKREEIDAMYYDAKQTETISVNVDTLDNVILEKNINMKDYNLLFMDTQCTEDKVIIGARNNLKYIDYVTAEIVYSWAPHAYQNGLTHDRLSSLLDYFGFTLLYEVPLVEHFKNIAANSFYIKKTLMELLPPAVLNSKFRPQAQNSIVSTQAPKEKLVHLEKSQAFSQLGDIFYKQINLGELDQAIAALDGIMKLLDMPRNIYISEIEDLCKIITAVSERLIGIQENKVAEKLAKTASLLSVSHSQNSALSS
jgi:FkbM family methyltransferase